MADRRPRHARAARRTLITGGTVIDGTGAPARRADVLIEGDRIAAITPQPRRDTANPSTPSNPSTSPSPTVGEAVATDPGGADHVIDAAGRWVVPGFVDIHSHSDHTLLEDPRAVSAIAQGVTTELVGNCGYGCFPVVDPATAGRAVYGLSPRLALQPANASSYLERLDHRRPAVNVATLIPHGQVRLAVLGDAQRAATQHEIRQMIHHVDEGLAAGAFGISSGLEYPQERATTPDEMVALCRPVAQANGLYATHPRHRGPGSVEAVDEAIETAQRAAVRLQVSHLLPRVEAETAGCLQALAHARERGVDVAFDMHTRTFGFTYLTALLPADLSGEADAAGPAGSDTPSRAEQAIAAHLQAYGLMAPAERIVIDQAPDSSIVGQSLAELTGRHRGSLVRCLAALHASADGDPTAITVRFTTYTTSALVEMFAHPWCLPASDAVTLCPDGPLASSRFHGAYTWAAWYFSTMRRDGRLADTEIVRRLTSAPADRIGLVGRGRLEIGAFADVVVLDPAAYAPLGTPEDPNQLARGVDHVLVNGQPATATASRAGRILRRP